MDKLKESSRLLHDATWLILVFVVVILVAVLLKSK